MDKMHKEKAESASAELLGELYRNAEMGCENLTSVVPMIKDKFLLTSVTGELERYSEYEREAENQLKSRGLKPKKSKMSKKMMSKGAIAMNTMFDSSDGHIAEMIERGTRLGAEQLEERAAELSMADERAKHLCAEMIDYERKEAAKMNDLTR